MLTLISETVVSRMEPEDETQACSEAMDGGWTEPTETSETDDVDVVASANDSVY